MSNPIIPKIVFILLLAAILFAGISLFDVVRKKQKVESEIEQINKEEAALIERKNELANLLDYFQDPRFIEKEARKRLNFQKPGEKVVVVTDEKEGVGDETPVLLEKKEKNIQQKPIGNIHKWFNFIFK